jgi:hypothetical protein
MTVGADRTQVGHGIDAIFSLALSYRPQVVNMSETFAHFAIYCSKIEPAHSATCAVVSNAGFTSMWVALISIPRNPGSFPLFVSLARRFRDIPRWGLRFCS